MRRRFVALAGALLLAAATALPAEDPADLAFPHLQNDPLYDQETWQALHDVVIDVSWKQRELGQVMRDLTLAVRTARPLAADVNFFISSSAPPDLRHRPVTLVLQRVHVFTLLAELGQQAGFTIRVHPGVVLVAPR